MARPCAPWPEPPSTSSYPGALFPSFSWRKGRSRDQSPPRVLQDVRFLDQRERRAGGTKDGAFCCVCQSGPEDRGWAVHGEGLLPQQPLGMSQGLWAPGGRGEQGQEGAAASAADILTISGAPCHWLVLVLWGQLWLPVWHASPQGRLRLTPLLQGAHRCLLGPPKQEVIIADPGWRNSAGFPKARVQFLRIPGTELPNPEPQTPSSPPAPPSFLQRVSQSVLSVPGRLPGVPRQAHAEFRPCHRTALGPGAGPVPAPSLCPWLKHQNNMMSGVGCEE